MNGVSIGWRCWFVLASIALCATLGSTVFAANLVQEFYLPIPEAQARQSFATIASGVGTTLDSITSIVITGDGALLVYDQWEDGYETDLAHPAQASTRIWGDGNDANGIPPGYAHDPASFSAGTVLTLRNNVVLPRNPATLLYDGRDRIGSNKGLVVTRAMWPTTPGAVLGGSVVVQSTLDFGTNFVSPVGQDMTNKLFTYVGMVVMAEQNGTLVTINTNVNGGTPFTITLNQGESYLVNGGVRRGGTVTATKPVEADLIIGHVGASYAADWFTLYPSDQWSPSYLTPVGSASSNPTYAYIYNPNSTNVTVGYDTTVSSGSFTVSSGSTYQFQMPVNSGARFVCTGGANIVVLSTVGANPTSDTAYNWGFNPLPDGVLTTEAVVGWGAGSSDGTVNGSPVWVTAAKATRLYVDYHGDRLGPLTDPNGLKYDTNFDIVAFQSKRIFDPSKDQTAMRIYTLDGTPISVAWGEDPSVAAPGNPYLDLGTSTLPFPTPKITKTVVQYVDTGGAGFSVGDALQYTVRVDNKGLVPLGNVVVVDAPSTNLAYIAGSTTFNGDPLPDSTTGTPFPLDAAGYTIPVILRGGTSTFQYLCTITSAGTISNRFSADAYRLVGEASVATPPTSNPNPQCFINFTDAGGAVVGGYFVGASIYVTLTNAAANTSSNTVQAATVVVRDTTSGDYEAITLIETGTNTGVFASAALPSSTTGGLGPSDGILHVAIGDSLTVSYTDPTYGNSSTATATMAAAAQIKVLYLSGTNAPDQNLDRVSPVANADTSTAQTVALGQGAYLTIGVDNTTSGTSITNNYKLVHTVGAGTNRLMLVGLSYNSTSTTVTNVTYGGLALTRLTNAANASSPKPRSEIWSLVNPPAGTTNLLVQLSSATTMYLTAGITTFSNVNQATPIGKLARATGRSRTPTVTIASDTNSLVLAVLAGAASTYTAGSGQTVRWNLSPGSVQGFGTTKPGAASVSSSWRAGSRQYYAATAASIQPALAPAVATATFTQTPVFCQDFVMPAGGTVAITNWVAITGGTMPTNPAVTATLLNGANTFLTLTNSTYSSSSNYLAWSGALSSNVTVAAGQAISYVVSNGQSGVTFKVNYDSLTNASKVVLPTRTVIAAQSIGIYDAAYPGGVLQSAPYNGQTLYARVVVSDPFGSSDITSVGLLIDGPGAVDDLSTTLTNAHVVSDDGCSRTYEYVWRTGATVGGYTITATANEGTEGVTSAVSTAVMLNFLDLGTPSTTVFTSSNNGIQTNSFAANSTAWIRVTDLNRNTSSTTLQTITVTVTGTGDSELVTLTETGTNSGVFTGGLGLTTTATGTNSGLLTAPQGSVIQVTYTDPTDSTDVSSDTAIIPAAAGTGAIRVSSTLLTANPTLVGNTVSIRIQVANTGSTNLPTVTLTNSFPTNALTFVSASGAPSLIVGTNLIWSNLGPLAPGQTTNLVLTFTATGTAAPATDTAFGSGGPGVTGSSSVSVTINHPSITVTKTRLSPTNAIVSIGSNVVFQIVVKNTGDTSIPTLPLEDNYSAAAFQYVSATIPPDGAGGGSLVWNNLATNALAAGDAITNLVTMKVVGEGYPADNTAHVDFATDINGNAVPAVSSTASVTNAAARITGSVYNDVDQSGTLTAGDTGLAGATLQLFTDPDGDGSPSDGTLVQITTTDSGGYYEFLNLAADRYVVIETDPSGYLSSSPVNNRIALNVNSLSTFSNNYFFDYVVPVTNCASASGYVWFDSNQNGLPDPGEPGVTNAFLELVQDVNTNGLADLGEPVLASAYADNNGWFAFLSVVTGNYVVRETDFFGWASTGDSQGPNDNQVAVTLSSGASVTNLWFMDYSAGGGNGYYPPVAAPDVYTVFEDITLSVASTNGVLANDFCTSGISNLTAILVTGTTNGILTLNTNTGAFTYVPNASSFGVDTFTYRVRDATTNSGITAVTITVVAVNDPPSYTVGASQTVLEDSGVQTVPNWAASISAGPANESTQTVAFVVSNSNSNLFSAQPVVSSAGTLTFTPTTNGYGAATVTIYAQDNGGTANGGADVSATNTFTITVTPVNDPPSFSLATNTVVVLEDAGGQTNAGFAIGISPGPPNESGQTVAFFVSNDNSGLFSVPPSISTNGTLSFTAAPNSNGVATVTVYAQDNGGTANGGSDTSTTNTFTIRVTPVNDPPTLAAIGNQTILEDVGTQTLTLSGVSAGPPNESSQTLTFTATSSNPGLIPNPTIVYTNGSTTGALIYTPTANSNGVTTITLVVRDNGGTTNGGLDRITNSFTITVIPVNDPPSFVRGADLSVSQKAGALTYTNWATSILPGPPDEAGQTVSFVVTNDAPGLFAVQPQLASNGTLTFTPATNADGTAIVTVIARDNGGTANGGSDTSAPQTFIISIGASELVPATGGEAISADTVGGAWTALSGPSYIEGNSGAIGVGTIILQVPPGFEFDTGGVAPTVRVQRNEGSGPDSLNLNGATNGQVFAVTSVTSTQITFTVTSASSNLVSDTLTWQNLRVRPTRGDLPSGELVLTSSGTAVIQQVQPEVTSWGRLAEIPGAPAQLVIGTEPSATATAGEAFAQQPVVLLKDAFGNLVTTAAGTVTATREAGSGTLQGTLTAAIINGVATFTNLYHNVATNITITFTSGSLTPVTSTEIAIQAAAADHLEMVRGNAQTGTVGAALPVNPAVRVVDAFGNPVPDVPVSFAVQTGGGSLDAATVASDANGLAAVSYTLGTVAGTNNNTMRASVSGLSGTPSSLTFTESAVPGPAAKLAIQTEPSATAIAGVAFVQQPVVLIEDQYGNVVTDANGLTVTAARDAGSGTLQGSLLTSTVNGVATFSGLNHLVATNITLVFSSGSLTPVTSTVVAIRAAGADHLVMVQGNNQTGTVASALPVNPTVRVVDAFGNPVVGANVTFAVQSGGGSVGTATVASDTNGLAATSYTLGTVAGTGNNTMTAAAAVAGNPSLITFTESAVAGKATQLAIHTQPSPTATAGVIFAQQPVIWVEDAYGNLVTNATGTVTATRNAGTGSLQGTPVATIVNGVATFTDLRRDIAGDITLNFSSGSFAPVTSTVVSVQAAVADHLVMVQGNNQTGTVGALVSTNPTVKVVDAFGNPVAGISVSFAVQTGGGHVGTAAVTSDTNGLAATTYTLGTVAGTSNNTMRASATVAGAPSNILFTESGVAGAPLRLAIYTQPSTNATAGEMFAQQPVVCVQDAYGNIVSNATGTVTAARDAGSGDLQGTLTATLVGGLAVFSDLSHNVATNITVTFSSGSLAPATSTPIAITAAAADHLVLVTGDGQTGTIKQPLPVNPTVRVVDAFENPVAGSTVTFTVLTGGGSVSPSSAVSDANGLVSTVYTLGSSTGTGNNTMEAALGSLDASLFTESASTTGLPVADITATVTGPSTVAINGQITYQITVRNLGPSNAVSIVVTNLLPAGVSGVTAPGGTISGTQVTWTLAALAAGASSNLTVTVTAPGTVGSLSDTVSSGSTTYDPQPGNNDGSAVGATAITVVQAADVQTTIAGPASAIAGTNLVYTILVTNQGPSTAAGVVVTNLVPAGLTIVDAPGGTINGKVITWNVGSLASGGWNSYTVTVTPPTTGGSFTNTVASTATTYDPVAANNNGTVAGGFVVTVVAPLNVAPTLTPISNQTINENAGPQILNLVGITAGGGASQTLTVTATSSNPGLIPNPVVGYTSPNSTGTLTFAPATNLFGTATITVVVRDNGGTANGGVDAVTNTFTITVNPVNQPPSFTKGGDQTVNEDSGAQTVAGWATAISPGPASESSQTVTFRLSNDNNSLFSVPPAVSSGGVLTYTPATNAFGTATVTIYVQDNGGTANGGVDVSTTNTFRITLNPVNDPPSFALQTNSVVVFEDCGAQSISLATNITSGPANESSQSVSFLVGNSSNSLFSVQPAIGTNGTLTFTPAANAYGTATVTVYAQDSGGTANGGVDTSVAQTLVITVGPVNDSPTLNAISSLTINENAGLQTINLSGITVGPANETGQALTLSVTSSDPSLIPNPTVSYSSPNATGTLTLTPAANVFGTATITVVVKDDGGTANFGVDSVTNTFTVTVNAVNQPPSFTKGADQTVLEDAGAQTVTNWATGISAGPANESWQTLVFRVSNNNSNLFSIQPAVSANGTLTYTPATNANGSATVTLYLQDNGGTTNGGSNSSIVQTFPIHVTAVNDPPSFTKGADQTVLMNAGAQTLTGWATGISAGPANESSQTLTFIVSNDNSGLFAVQPAVSATGTLTYTPAANASGSATVTVYLRDNGGTANGGIDTSPTQTFTIQVTAYSIGNRVFGDLNNNGSRDYGEDGISGARMVLFTNGPSGPAGSPLMTVVTDANGDYRFDNVPAGSYVVVVDQANSPSLFGYVSSSGCATNLTLDEDMRDHGQDTPVTVGTVVDGIASLAVTVGPNLQPTNEVVANGPGLGQHGPCGDAFDNLVVDFSFAPTYSLGNRVFYDDNHNGFQEAGENGVPGVPMYAFAVDANGAPTGTALASATTDAGGWYRLDGLRAGTYAVVMDRVTANLGPYTISIPATNQMGIEGDLWNHGWYFPQITVGNVTNGYASAPVTVGLGFQPLGEATSGISGEGAHGPLGDAYDNLVLDFGLTRTFCIGNRVFADDGSGGGIANNGIQDGTEPGIPNVALRVFAADVNGNPTGDPLVIGAAGLNVAVTDTNGYYRFFRLAAGTYVVVVDVELSRNLIGYTNLGGATVQVPGAHSSSLVGYASSLGYSTNATLAGDLLDHGKDTLVSVGAVSNGIAGPPITVGDGLQPLGEATNGVAGSGAHGPSGDAFDNLTMDFGFALTFSLGNRVFADDGSGGGTAGNGIQDGGEPGIANATVQLQTNGVTLATATTDANGYYRFDDLLAGFYTAFLPATDFAVTGALAGMLSSTGTQAGDRGDKGVDNASPAVNGVVSTPIAVGLGLQPAGETDLGTGAGGHGLNGDAYDNLTIDFGLVGANSYPCSIGSLVWHDANNNGVYDTGESGILGVTLEVWSSDVSGNLIGSSAVATTATGADGTYFVGNLAPGTYRVKLPAGNFGAGGPLNSVNTSSTLRQTQDNQVDGDNNGLQASAGGEVLSTVITLSRGGEPVNGVGAPNEFGPGAALDDGGVDANGDMTVNFGFFSPTTDQSNLCSLGSMVWTDANNNGVWDSGETGIAGVRLELYQTNAGGLVYWASTASGSDGTFFFKDLPAGSNWVVHIPATNFIGALAAYPLSSGTPVNADNQVDNDNNGLQPGGLGAEVWSPIIHLVAGSEPTDGSGESGPGYDRDDAGGCVDANGDMTVDFGFTPTYSLGNLVFLDVNNNGVMDGADVGLSGVIVKLFAADGFGNPAGAVLATATTDAGGYYRFDNLVKGTYVVVVDKANSPSLAGYVSSTGVSAGLSLGGDSRDHGKDAPVSVGTVVNGIAGVPVALGPGLQPTGEATGSGAGAHGPNGDGTDNLVVDFGFTPTYSLGNRIYRDPDNDGQPDLDNLDEGGMDGVQLAVYAADGSGNPNGSELGRTTSSDGGFYRFDGLVSGTYVVVVDKANSPALDGYVSAAGFSTNVTASGEMYDHGQDTPLGAGSVLPGGIASGPIPLGPGLQPLGEATWTGQGANGSNGDAADNLVIDFGFAPLFSLGNRVFADVNNNGILDGGDAGISGVRLAVFAADASGNPTGGALATTNTDASGYYRFDGLPAGEYVVVVDVSGSGSALAGYVSSAGASSDVLVTGDRKDHGRDASESVGTVANGIVSTPVVVGAFAVVPLVGEPDVSTNAGAHGPNGDDADYLVVDFGFTPTYSLGNRVFADNGAGGGVANDGIRNGTEPGIADVRVLVFAADGAGNPTGSELAATSTDANGYYRFDGLVLGSYVVVVDPANSPNLAGYVSSARVSSDMAITGDLKDHGKDALVSVGGVVNGIASAAVTVGPGLQPASEATGSGAGANGPGGDARDNLVLDFGFAPTASVAGRVLADVNGDGLAGAEDTNGISGVTVVLQTTNGVPVATSVTSAGGAYGFTNVAPGSYLIAEIDLPGWISTTGNQIPLALLSGQTRTNLHFLDTQPAQISGSVTLDLNGNGVADAGDSTGVSPVVLSAYLNGTNLVATVTNNADGSYALLNLPPGNYAVVQTVPQGYLATAPTTVHLTLTSASTGTANFLDARPASIVASVLLDINGDGVADAEDTNGISGVTLELQTVAGAPVATNATSADGTCLFTNVPPGSYAVVQTVSAGYLATTPIRVSVTLTSGSTGTARFLDTQPGSIAAGVLLDINGNGVAEAEDTNQISGVTLVLQTTNGVPVATNLTRASGMQFTNVPPGSYTLAQTVPPGYLATTPTSLTVTLTSGQASTGNQFLDAQMGSIAGAVLEDINGNGVFNDEDTNAIAGATIVLQTTNGVPVATNLTGTAGFYFSSVPPGSYALVQLVPPGCLATTPANLTVTLTSGQALMGIRFLDSRLGDIAGRVLVDLNGDGVFDVSDTNGIPGVTTVLQTAAGVPLATNVTSVGGAFSFPNLPPGSYVVVETDLLGWISTADTVPPSDNRIPLTLTSSQNSTGNNFLDMHAGSIAGSVWVDVNGNSSFDAEDTNGISGVTVILQTTNGVNLATNVTSSSGGYQFSDWLPGNYVVVEIDPPDWSSTADTAPPNDNRVSITLTSAEDSTGNNFLDMQTGSIAGNVLVDVNGNGVVNAEDTNGIAGVTVVLQTADGNPFSTELTSVSGAYQFTNVPPGNYVVVESNLSGWTSTGDSAPPNDDRVAVALTSGQASTNNNFLDTTVGSISGAVLVDWNGNGMLDAEETNGMIGVTVSLQTAGGVPLASTVTGVGGAYSFGNVPLGNYVVVETDWPGWLSTADSAPPNDNRIPLTLLRDQSLTGNNFLDAQPVSLAGVVRLDVNGNGVADAEDSSPIAPVVIQVYTPGAALVAAATNSPDGTFNFTGLVPGTYTVTQTVPSGYLATTPASVGVTLTSGGLGAVSFLDTQPASVAGAVLVDVNSNGIVDAEDTNGLAGVTLVLRDTNGVPVLTNLTSASGAYLFSGVPPGNYVLVGTPPPGWIHTADSAPPNDNRIPLTLLSGQASTGNDFLATRAFSLGNRVFADNGMGGGTANNGIQDGTEPGIPTVLLKLYAADGSGNPTGNALGTTNTDAGGYYRFDGVRAGTYVVVVDLVGSGGALSGLIGSPGETTNTTLAGDLRDHGKDVPLGSGSVLPGGIASVSVQVGIGLQPTNELTAVSGAGTNGPGGDSSDNLTMDFGFRLPSPTAVVVGWLGAFVDQRQVWVTWQTFSEYNLLGFEIWRSPGLGQAELVTPDLVFAEGQASGQTYRVLDSTAVLPGHYLYRLEGWYDDLSTRELARVEVNLAAGASVDVVRITGVEMRADGLRVRWVGGQPPYLLESSPECGPGAIWTPVGPANPGTTEAVVPVPGSSGFWRVKGGATRF